VVAADAGAVTTLLDDSKYPPRRRDVESVETGTTVGYRDLSPTHVGAGSSGTVLMVEGRRSSRSSRR
jgi:hypothetical protein